MLISGNLSREQLAQKEAKFQVGPPGGKQEGKAMMGLFAALFVQRCGRLSANRLLHLTEPGC